MKDSEKIQKQIDNMKLKQQRLIDKLVSVSEAKNVVETRITEHNAKLAEVLAVEESEAPIE